MLAIIRVEVNAGVTVTYHLESLSDRRHLESSARESELGIAYKPGSTVGHKTVELIHASESAEIRSLVSPSIFQNQMTLRRTSYHIRYHTLEISIDITKRS